MSRALGRIAAFGLSIGILSLALAHALGRGDFNSVIHRNSLPACGDGPAPTSARHLAWAGGDAIEIALAAMVHFRGSEGDDIVLRGPPDILAHVELQGDRLTLNCSGSTRRDLDITLPGKPFRRVNLSGSVKLSMENLNQPELALSISGSGTLRGQGSVDQLSVTVSGSGNAKLVDIAIKQLTVKIAGSGTVEAAPKDDADIDISGSGDVRLLSRPTRLTNHISGSGRITQARIEAAEGKR